MPAEIAECQLPCGCVDAPINAGNNLFLSSDNAICRFIPNLRISGLSWHRPGEFFYFHNAISSAYPSSYTFKASFAPKRSIAGTAVAIQLVAIGGFRLCNLNR